MSAAASGLRVAVVGATGAVGTVMLRLLRSRGFPASEIVPFASERSVGRELEGGLVVAPLDDETIQGFDVVGSSRVDLQACKLEYSIVSPK